jgi:hypothetical protein
VQSGARLLQQLQLFQGLLVPLIGDEGKRNPCAAIDEYRLARPHQGFSS